MGPSEPPDLHATNALPNSNSHKLIPTLPWEWPAASLDTVVFFTWVHLGRAWAGSQPVISPHVSSPTHGSILTSLQGVRAWAGTCKRTNPQLASPCAFLVTDSYLGGHLISAVIAFSGLLPQGPHTLKRDPKVMSKP